MPVAAPVASMPRITVYYINRYKLIENNARTLVGQHQVTYRAQQLMSLTFCIRGDVRVRGDKALNSDDLLSPSCYARLCKQSTRLLMMASHAKPTVVFAASVAPVRVDRRYKTGCWIQIAVRIEIGRFGHGKCIGCATIYMGL